MRGILAAVMTMICLGGQNLMATDDPKTLPPEMYETMKSGGKLDKVFIDPSYDKTKGFKLGSVDYRAEIMNSTVPEALTKSVKMLAKSDSPYTLHMTITKVTAGHKLLKTRVRGRLTIEGKIVDTNSKIIVAFTTREAAGEIGADADNFQIASDKIATAISKDLL